MIYQRLTERAIALVILVAVSLLLAACTVATGPSVEFKPAAPEVAAEGVAAEPVSTATNLAEVDPELSDSRLGFVQKREAIAMKNGGQVPLGEDKVVEVFLSPYPPDWQTDLHLFLMDNETYQPITDVDVDLIYDMVYMDHGIDAQIGTKVADGHYVLPLSFLMYGDWSVDITARLPEGKKHLRFIVKFFP